MNKSRFVNAVDDGVSTAHAGVPGWAVPSPIGIDNHKAASIGDSVKAVSEAGVEGGFPKTMEDKKYGHRSITMQAGWNVKEVRPVQTIDRQGAFVVARLNRRHSSRSGNSGHDGLDRSRSARC